MKKRVGDHLRNISAMRSSQRCGAKTRAGGACQSPAVAGKRRCRMHGGAKGSGAPQGNQNALKHGGYTYEALEERRFLSDLLRASRQTLSEID